MMNKCPICGKENVELLLPRVLNINPICEQCYQKYEIAAQNEEGLPEENIHRPTWSETYFEIAKVFAKRSHDPRTKVGAVLVKNGVIIGLGYNGAPRKFRMTFDWNSAEKYTYVIHAEMNAVANACAAGASVVGADMYLTLSPCHDCMKLLIQHQIKNIYYLEEYKDIVLSKKIAGACGIKLQKYEP